MFKPRLPVPKKLFSQKLELVKSKLSPAQMRGIEFVADKLTLLSSLELNYVLNELSTLQKSTALPIGKITYSKLEDQMLNDRFLTSQ